MLTFSEDPCGLPSGFYFLPFFLQISTICSSQINKVANNCWYNCSWQINNCLCVTNNCSHECSWQENKCLCQWGDYFSYDNTTVTITKIIFNITNNCCCFSQTNNNCHCACVEP